VNFNFATGPTLQPPQPRRWWSTCRNDVLFWLEHVTHLYSLNSLDVIYAINELKAMGNQQAELIVTSGKGYRPDLGGIRMPHAWSIVDEPDLANWIEQKIR